MNSLEQMLEDLFLKKMPGLSGNAREIAAKALPWVLIVLGVLGFLAWISSLRFFFGFSGLSRYIPGYAPDIFAMVQLVIAPVIQIMAIYGGYLMLSRQHRGWNLSLYALLIGFFSHLLSVSIFGIFLDFAVAYLLFQIKECFTEKVVN